jgi:hypothetical protein
MPARGEFTAMRPGRSCPLHYRYTAAEIARVTPLAADCIYVVGGLYGNAHAFDAVSELAAHEARAPVIVFNGDFNWFNADAAGFAALNNRVLAHTALRGNVETELAGDDTTAGCGCGYPDFVGDAEVERSNRIIERLRDTARALPALRRRLAALPMYMTAAVGASRVAIVHGDCESLAGWGLSREALAAPDARARVTRWFETAGVDVIASSHSCLPVMREFATQRGAAVVANNGAAGMPNFAGTRHGVITRIGITPSPHEMLFGTRVNDVHVDALPVHYDQQRWLAAFLANWPAGSPAHASYHQRIVNGPAYRAKEAAQLTVSNAPALRPIAA